MVGELLREANTGLHFRVVNRYRFDIDIVASIVTMHGLVARVMTDRRLEVARVHIDALTV